MDRTRWKRGSQLYTVGCWVLGVDGTGAYYILGGIYTVVGEQAEQARKFERLFPKQGYDDRDDCVYSKANLPVVYLLEPRYC